MSGPKQMFTKAAVNRRFSQTLLRSCEAGVDTITQDKFDKS